MVEFYISLLVQNVWRCRVVGLSRVGVTDGDTRSMFCESLSVLFLTEVFVVGQYSAQVRTLQERQGAINYSLQKKKKILLK